MKYILREHATIPDIWEVVGTLPDGSFYIAMFGGDNAKLHAADYLVWKTKVIL